MNAQLRPTQFACVLPGTIKVLKREHGAAQQTYVIEGGHEYTDAALIKYFDGTWGGDVKRYENETRVTVYID